MNIEYNNLYTHFVFSTLHRLPIIPSNQRVRIEKYITGIVKNSDCSLYSIYANPEHIHFLVSRAPHISEETLASLVENGSEIFINRYNLCPGVFRWQDTCSAFSVSKSGVDRVCRYILNQEVHHRKASFAEEYETFLKFYQKTIILK
jgi:REP element-mobilizing transposase RayT